MDYNHAGDLSELRPYEIKDFALDSAIAIDNYRINGKISTGDERPINELSKIFFMLSEISSREISPEISFELKDFYWPKSKDDYSGGNKKLIGKKWEDFNLQSWFFAKDLSTFREQSEDKRNKLMNNCLKLNRKFSIHEGYRHCLAA